jgi:hypothetical protein
MFAKFKFLKLNYYDFNIISELIKIYHEIDCFFQNKLIF